MEQNKDIFNYLTPFNGFLRSMRCTDMTDLGRKVFAYAFPGFFNKNEIDPEKLKDNIDALSKQYDKIFVNRLMPRRFSGDFYSETFPRSRYYTIAKDHTGNDQRTLIKELLAYSNPNRTGPLITADAIQPQDIKELKEIGVDISLQDAIIIITILPGENEYTGVAYSLDTCLVHIENCVDLRLLSTQEWFYSKFRKGDGEIFQKFFGDNIHCFTDMLPALMWPSLGGGGIYEHGAITQAIGKWMRKNNVEAFIYPSARLNAYVKYSNTELIDFYGWNLIDYRNSSNGIFEGAESMFISHDAPWPEALPYPSNLKIHPCGSWQFEGPEKFQLKQAGLE